MNGIDATAWGPWTLLAAGAASMCALHAVVWLISLRIRNAGIVDVAWAGGFSLLALLYGLLGPGWPPRRLLIATMTALWSLRLAGYLYARVMGQHPEEDGRYAELRRRWAGRNLALRFLVFFQIQAALDVVLGVPLLIACLDPEPRLRATEWAAAALWLAALAGESLADRQLARFKADPANRGKVCDAGLWRLSRHPNYFFEWLVWCAFALFALGSPWGAVGLYCPALMLFFLYRVTGIPATEEQALRTKGEAYRRYQETTSTFVPWFPNRR